VQQKFLVMKIQILNSQKSRWIFSEKSMILTLHFSKQLIETNKDDLPEYLPPSLERAIKSFILTCAIRQIRGHENKHNSMLGSCCVTCAMD
jgi:hypothetical protein